MNRYGSSLDPNLVLHEKFSSFTAGFLGQDIICRNLNVMDLEGIPIHSYDSCLQLVLRGLCPDRGLNFALSLMSKCAEEGKPRDFKMREGSALPAKTGAPSEKVLYQPKRAKGTAPLKRGKMYCAI